MCGWTEDRRLYQGSKKTITSFTKTHIEKNQFYLQEHAFTEGLSTLRIKVTVG